MRLLHALLALVLLLGLVAPTAGATPSADPSADPKLTQTVEADEKVDRSPVEVGAGHVDLGPRFEGDQLQLMGRDDTVTPKLWRPLDQLVLRVNDKALLEVPGEEAYSFLQVPAGKKVHVIPQTELPGVLWLGWNTQDPRITQTIGRGADLVLLRHQGPGRLHVFLANGFDAPMPLWDSSKPAGQKIFMQVNTHVHANWVFTEPGVHLVEAEVRATNQKTHKPISARAVLRFAVGDAARADQARSAQMSGASPAPSSSAAPSQADPSAGTPGARDATQQESASAGRSSTPTVMWVGLAAAAVVVVGGAAVALRQRRLRAAAWSEGDDE